jgi:hypothetical protein
MQISDWINVSLCILSFILAAISVVTVVITLRQNNKMIQNSTRPYIVAFAQITNFQEPTFYLVIKNFGVSGATIEKMECSIELNQVSYRDEMTPFNHIEGTFLAPGQSITSSLYSKKFKEHDIKDFNVTLHYSDGIKNYVQDCLINYKVFIENVNVRAATKDKELRTISYALQDLVEKQF